MVSNFAHNWNWIIWLYIYYSAMCLSKKMEREALSWLLLLPHLSTHKSCRKNSVRFPQSCVCVSVWHHPGHVIHSHTHPAACGSADHRDIPSSSFWSSRTADLSKVCGSICLWVEVNDDVMKMWVISGLQESWSPLCTGFGHSTIGTVVNLVPQAL